MRKTIGTLTIIWGCGKSMVNRKQGKPCSHTIYIMKGGENMWQTIKELLKSHRKRKKLAAYRKKFNNNLNEIRAYFI